MSPFQNKLISLCRKKQSKIIFPEGSDDRILRTINILLTEQSFASVTVLGERREIERQAKALGVDLAKHDDRLIFNDSYDFSLLKDFLQGRRKEKNKPPFDQTTLNELGHHALYQGLYLVATGQADTLVAGAVFTTAEVMKAGLAVIGLAEGVSKISSSFLLEAKEQPHESGSDFMLFADAGVIIDPSAEDLVSIASEATKLWRSLMPDPPRVAFLSFSTKGSASHASVSKMNAAAAMFREKYPLVTSDGDLQFDAALVPEIARRKAPQSPLQGKANIFIFPDLNAGNIAYKIVQRIGGYHAYGPLLQGFGLPLSDLSRGASEQDIRICSYISSLRA